MQEGTAYWNVGTLKARAAMGTVVPSLFNIKNAYYTYFKISLALKGFIQPTTVFVK